MVADPGAFNPYGQPAQGGFGGSPAGVPPAGGGYGSPPPGGYGSPPPGGPAGGVYGGPPPGGPQAGGYGSPDPGGGYGAPPAGGGYGSPSPGQPGGGYGAPAGGGYGGAPAAAPMGGYGGMPGGGAPMVQAGGRGPIGQTRNPIMVLVIGSICFIYAIIQLWGMVNELKAFRGKDDINPIMMFVPIMNIIFFWNLPAKVLEAKQMAGVPNPQVAHPILYLLLGSYFLPADLNEVWQAAGGGQPR